MVQKMPMLLGGICTAVNFEHCKDSKKVRIMQGFIKRFTLKIKFLTFPFGMSSLNATFVLLY